MRTLIVIPARLASQRLAEKLLLKLHGKEIILWVAQSVKKTGFEYIIAIDDEALKILLQNAGEPFIMTSTEHVSGTSRLTEVRDLMPNYDYYCLVQGDEPFIKCEDIREFISQAIEKRTGYVQAVTRFKDGELPSDTSNVKAVISKTQKLIYASRSLIPHNLNEMTFIEDYLQIAGLYFFSNLFLENYKLLPTCELETAERVEQVRCLYNDIDIDTVLVKHGMHSIDTSDDYEYFKQNSFVNDGDIQRL